MFRTRSFPAALAVTVAFTAAACGAATTTRSGSAASPPPATGVTSAFPTDTLALVAVNTDRQSPAWTTLTSILAHFRTAAPPRAATTTHRAGNHQLSFQRDIQPWLGKNAAIGVLGITLAGGRPAPEVVLVAESRNDTNAQSFLASHAKADGSYRGYAEYRTADGKLVGAISAGSVLIATDTASLDRVIDTRRNGGASLATTPAYTATLAALPTAAAATAYVNGPQLADLAAIGVAFAGHQANWSALAAMSHTGTPSANTGRHQPRSAAITISPAERAALLTRLRRLASGLRHLTSLGAALVPTSSGLHVRLVALTDQANGHDLTTLHTAALLAHLPADTVAAADTAFNRSAVSSLVSDATNALRTATGKPPKHTAPRIASTLTTILPALLSGEAAAYLTGGAPPTAGLLISPANPTAATNALEKVTALLANAAHTTPPAASTTGQAIHIHGHVLSWTRSGALVVVGADTGGALPTGGLASNPTFSAAATAAGLPSQIDAFAYADVPGLLSLARRADRKHPIDTRISSELAAVKGVIGWSTATPGVASIDLFAMIG
jgi:hypothetical protein